MKMENKNLTAYSGKDICSRESLFKEGFYSENWTIKEFGYKRGELVLGFNKSGEGDGKINLHILTHEGATRNFLYDIGIYDIFAYPKGAFVESLEKLVNVELEVFFTPQNHFPIAVSPIFKSQKTQKIAKQESH
jgi:hypothetical protein